MAKLLSALPVGSIVKSTNTKYNGKVIRWIVGTQDTANGRTGLVVEKMITLKCFDAKESSNPNSSRQSYGNNRYSQSNIDQWLNSQDAAWYSARHSYDAPPNNANVWNNYNEYDTEAGFLSNFEADFRKAILDAVIRVAKNTVTDGGGYEDITRKVFLLSNTEVGLEGLIQSVETVKNDYVRGVPRNLIRLVLDPVTYGKARNYLDKNTNNANVDTAAEDFAMFHGVRVYSSINLPVKTETVESTKTKTTTCHGVAMIEGAIAQPAVIYPYKEPEKIPLSNDYGVSMFFDYGTKALTPDLIFTYSTSVTSA